MPTYKTFRQTLLFWWREIRIAALQARIDANEDDTDYQLQLFESLRRTCVTQESDIRPIAPICQIALYTLAVLGVLALFYPLVITVLT